MATTEGGGGGLQCYFKIYTTGTDLKKNLHVASEHTCPAMVSHIAHISRSLAASSSSWGLPPLLERATIHPTSLVSYTSYKR
jgi:hypothetical protein